MQNLNSKLHTSDFSRRALLLGGTALLVSCGVKSKSINPVIAQTGHGPIKGAIVQSKNGADVLSYLGVRYAQSAAGENRFMPPQTPKPWTEVQTCTQYGASTPQARVSFGASRVPNPNPDAPKKPFHRPPISTAQKVEDEDCLFLNVWTPANHAGNPSEKRAVLFWLHGGGFTTGSGSANWYDGRNLAALQNVVVVTINHRLNVHGFCDLSAYGPQYAHSGNVGMLDCVKALQWVRDNIENFGGDPDRVMIFGESGGGRKTSMLMGYKPAQGLFHRAGVQSGSSLRLDTKVKAQAKAAAVIKALGIKPENIADLHKVSVEALKKVAGQVLAKQGQFQPVVDGDQLPAHPFSPDAPSMSAHIPMIIGSNRTETAIFMGPNPIFDDLSPKTFMAMMAASGFGDKGLETAKFYRELHPSKSMDELYYMATTDRGYFLDACIQATRKARQAANGGAPIYSYGFYRETPVQNGRYYAPHAEEIPFVFNVLENGAPMVGPRTEMAQNLADQMSEAWCNFAKTGVPSAKGLTPWTAFNETDRPTMIFKEGVSAIQNDPRSRERLHMMQFGSQQEQDI